MKFLDEIGLEQINQLLKVDGNDCHVNGGVDVYSTKPAGSDKKLYKTIDRHFDTLLQQEESFNAFQQAHSGSAAPQTGRSGFADALSVSPTQTFASQAKAKSVPSKGPRRSSHSEYYSSSLKNSPFLATMSQSLETQQSTILAAAAPQSAQPAAHSNGRKTSTSEPNDGTSPSSPFGPLNSNRSRRIFTYLIAILNATHPDHDFSSLTPSDFKRLPSVTTMMNEFSNTLMGLGTVRLRSGGGSDSMFQFDKNRLDWLWEAIDQHIDLKSGDAVVYQYEPSPDFIDDVPGLIWSQTWFVVNTKKKRVAFLYLEGHRFKDGRRGSRTRGSSGNVAHRLKSAGKPDGISGDDAEDDDIIGTAFDRQHRMSASAINYVPSFSTLSNENVIYDGNNGEGEYDLTMSTDDELSDTELSAAIDVDDDEDYLEDDVVGDMEMA